MAIHYYVIGLLLVFLSSCASKSVLLYDDYFFTAEPQVVSAWKTLPLWQGANQRFLSSSSSVTLEKVITVMPSTTGLVVAILLSSEDRHNLVKNFPNRRIIFVGGQETPGVNTATVSPTQAWIAVASAVAKQDPSTAWVLYPEQATAESRAAFAQSWQSHGGKSLVELQGTGTVKNLADYHQGFDWVGSDSDATILQSASGEVVHGLPPLSETGIRPGISWVVSPTLLVRALYNDSTAAIQYSFAVPVETRTQGH